MKVLLSVLIGVALLGLAAVTAPRVAVMWAQWRSPEVVFSVSTDDRVVALTLDDGPSSATPRLLDVLAKHGARATFFLIGEHLRERPEVARRIVEEGHEVGHHMMEDRPSRALSGEAFEARFEAMDELLDDLGGSDVFRPGAGWYDDRMVREVRERGYRTVLGSVYPFDVHLPAPRLLSWYVLRSTGPGAILVLHDGPERGLRTAEILDRVLPELRRRGYRIVTVSTLLSRASDASVELRRLEPGREAGEGGSRRVTTRPPRGRRGR